MKTRLFLFLMLLACLAADCLAATETTLYLNKTRGFAPFRYGCEEGLVIENLTDTLQFDYLKFGEDINKIEIVFRAKNENANPLKKYPYYDSDGRKNHVKNPKWGFFITTTADTVVVMMQGNEEETLPEPTPCLDIRVYKLSDGSSHVKKFISGFNPYDKDNIWKVTVNEGIIGIKGGDTGIQEIFNLSLGKDLLTGFGYIAGWGARLVIDDIGCTLVSDSDNERNRLPFIKDKIDEYLSQSTDMMEGYWTIYDRDLEESLLKMGGQYVMACIKNGDDYIFLYLDGAVVNQNAWTPGDEKIVLHPTPFRGLYDVEWTDSMKEKLKYEIRAQRGEGETLLFQFPYQSSKLRLRRMP